MILVTGGAGFVGRAVVVALVSENRPFSVSLCWGSRTF